MKAIILHEIRGRIRIRVQQPRMTLEQADLLEAWLLRKPWARQVSVHERTCCVILHYAAAVKPYWTISAASLGKRLLSPFLCLFTAAVH